jgi:predicted enzyme related to lactoylglutathione lyase
MLNYLVDDLDPLLDPLGAEGAATDPKREDSEYGRFVWIIDPEGSKIELWEPPKSA